VIRLDEYTMMPVDIQKPIDDKKIANLENNPGELREIFEGNNQYVLFLNNRQKNIGKRGGCSVKNSVRP
jgi:hypothetical protein